MNYKLKLFTKSWNVAYKMKNDKNFTIIRNNYNSWTADPFVFEYEGKTYIFGEIYEYERSKGAIGYSEYKNGRFTRWKVVIREDYHLSFPYIVVENSNIYIYPESSSNHTFYRYKAINFPLIWKKEKIFIKDRDLVDTVLFKYIDKNFGLTLDIKDNKNELLLFEMINNKIIFLDKNPISKDMSVARCGGKILYNKDKLIRVSQKCDRFYGEALNFSMIESLVPYNEKLIKTVTPKEISLNKTNNFIGIHTYNESDNFQVVDLQSCKFELVRFIIRCKNKVFKFLKNQGG